MASSIFGNHCRVLMAAAKSAAASTASATKTKTKPAAASTASVTKTKTKPAVASTASAAKPKSARGTTGIAKVQIVSPALSEFVGSPEVSRSEAVKKIWDYIKSHNLQNPDNKREILCDDKLKTIFEGHDKVHFYGITKLLSNHFPKATKAL